MSIHNELQEKHLALNYLRQQADALVQDLNLLTNSINTLDQTKDTLDYINKIKEKHILVPLGGSAFVKAEIQDPGNVLIDVGADIWAKKPISAAQELLTDRLNTMKTAQTQLQNQIQQANQTGLKLDADMRKMTQELGKQ